MVLRSEDACSRVMERISKNNNIFYIETLFDRDYFKQEYQKTLKDAIL